MRRLADCPFSAQRWETLGALARAWQGPEQLRMQHAFHTCVFDILYIWALRDVMSR